MGMNVHSDAFIQASHAAKCPKWYGNIVTYATYINDADAIHSLFHERSAESSDHGGTLPQSFDRLEMQILSSFGPILVSVAR